MQDVSLRAKGRRGIIFCLEFFWDNFFDRGHWTSADPEAGADGTDHLDADPTLPTARMQKGRNLLHLHRPNLWKSQPENATATLMECTMGGMS